MDFFLGKIIGSLFLTTHEVLSHALKSRVVYDIVHVRHASTILKLVSHLLEHRVVHQAGESIGVGHEILSHLLNLWIVHHRSKVKASWTSTGTSIGVSVSIGACTRNITGRRR